MTRNITQIWPLRPGSGSRTQNMIKIPKSYDKNVKIMWNWEITLFSYLFHIISILFSHFGARDPGLGPKAAARGPGRAWPAAALGPGPGFRAPKCENNIKKYENDVISHFHIIFIFYSYYFHIFITFWGSGPRSGPHKSYFCHIPGHIFFILFSYFCISLGWGPCPDRNLWNGSFTTLTDGQAGDQANSGWTDRWSGGWTGGQPELEHRVDGVLAVLKGLQPLE